MPVSHEELSDGEQHESARETKSPAALKRDAFRLSELTTSFRAADDFHARLRVVVVQLSLSGNSTLPRRRSFGSSRNFSSPTRKDCVTGQKLLIVV